MIREDDLDPEATSIHGVEGGGESIHAWVQFAVGNTLESRLAALSKAGWRVISGESPAQLQTYFRGSRITEVGDDLETAVTRAEEAQARFDTEDRPTETITGLSPG